MIKRSILYCLIAALTLVQLTPFTVSASPGDDLFDRFLDFAYENVSLMRFHEKDSYSIRAAYSISLPDDTGEVHQLIMSEYSSCQFVYLIEYGYAYIGPIVQSLYVCIGEANGSLVILDTPFDIMKKAYDFTIFDDIDDIKILKLGGT